MTIVLQESLLNCPGDDVGRGSGSNMELLHFGEDYRLFINSLSDTSVTNESKFRSKKLRRKNKRREVKYIFELILQAYICLLSLVLVL